jgi:hypothetical protein
MAGASAKCSGLDRFATRHRDVGCGLRTLTSNAMKIVGQTKIQARALCANHIEASRLLVFCPNGGYCARTSICNRQRAGPECVTDGMVWRLIPAKPGGTLCIFWIGSGTG